MSKIEKFEVKIARKRLGDLFITAKGGVFSLAEFLADNEDGPAADAWLQCVVFGGGDLWVS